jgi:hypothetical protein
VRRQNAGYRLSIFHPLYGNFHYTQNKRFTIRSKKMKKDRLQTLLKNAINWIDNENSDFFVSEVSNEYEWYQQAIGITKKELLELNITWIKEDTSEEE